MEDFFAPTRQPEAATTFDLSEINGTPPKRIEPPPSNDSPSGVEVAPIGTMLPTSTTRTETSPPPSKPERTGSPGDVGVSASLPRVSTNDGTAPSLPQPSTDASKGPLSPVATEAPQHSDAAGSLSPAPAAFVDLLKPSEPTNRHPRKDKDETGSGENHQSPLPIIAASSDNPAPTPAPGARSQSKNASSDKLEPELQRDKVPVTPLRDVVSTGLASLKPSLSDAENAGPFLPPIKIEGREHSSPETAKPALAPVKSSILPGVEVVNGTTSGALEVVSNAPVGDLHGPKAPGRRDLAGSLERLLTEESKLPPATPFPKNKDADSRSGSQSIAENPEKGPASPIVAVQNAIGGLLPEIKARPLGPEKPDSAPPHPERLRASTYSGDPTELGQFIQKTVKPLENIVEPSTLKTPDIKLPEVKLTSTTPSPAQTAFHGELTRLLSNEKSGTDTVESKTPVAKPVSVGEQLKTTVETAGAIGAPIVAPNKAPSVENASVKPPALNRQNAENVTGPIAGPNNFDKSSSGKTVDTVSPVEQNVSRQAVGNNITPGSIRVAEAGTANGGTRIESAKAETVNNYNRISSTSIEGATVIDSFVRIELPPPGKDAVLRTSVPTTRLDASVFSPISKVNTANTTKKAVPTQIGLDISASVKPSSFDLASRFKTDATAGSVTLHPAVKISTVNLPTASGPTTDSAVATAAVSPVVKVDTTTSFKSDSSAVKANIPAGLKAEQPDIKVESGRVLKGDVTLGIKTDAAASAKVEISTAVKTDAVSGLKADVAATGTKSDIAGGIKSDIVNGTKSDIANGIKADVTNSVKSDASNGNRSDVPTGTKGDVNPGNKTDGAGSKIESGIGRPINGIKVDAGEKGSLTPHMVATIADAIRLGLPLPEGVACQNGEIALRYGNEVLYFPGLKAALKFAEIVGLIEAEVIEEDFDSDVGSTGVDTRVRYSVQEGETVESIAAVQLGDPRFTDLIITINRAEILYRLVEDAKVPFVYAGQVIWLPSDPELNVYRKNFFSKKSGGINPAAPRLSGEVTAQKESNSREALQEEFIESCAQQKTISSPRTTVRDLPQMQLSDSMKNVASVIKVESAEADFGPSTVFVAPEAERLLNVILVSRDARIIVSDFASNPSRSFVKLEVKVDGMWAVASIYDCTQGETSRTRKAKNGVKSTMMLHLPSDIVRTMAVEDFSRNWCTYRANYVAGNVKNSLVDSVPPTPVDFARVGIRLQPSA